MKNQQRRQERAARTRRLIQHGALTEKYLNCTGMATEDFENVLAGIVAIEDVKALLPTAGHEDGKTSMEKEK